MQHTAKRSGPGRPGNVCACAICGKTPLGEGSMGSTWCSECWSAYKALRKSGAPTRGFAKHRRVLLGYDAATPFGAMQATRAA